MDKMGRITSWQEWEVGKTYVWMKGGKFIPMPCVCVEVNKKEGFVKLRSPKNRTVPDGQEFKHFAWNGRWVAFDHPLLSSNAIGTCPDLKKMFSEGLRFRSRPINQSCGNCDYFGIEVKMCFNDDMLRILGAAQFTEPGHWCALWKKPT